MSNISVDQKIETMPELMAFFEARIKEKLYTALPAIVQSFDPEKRRVTIILAIQREITDGTTREIQQLLNVPVLFPAAGGFSIFLPIKSGDSVMVVFSQRGIENFKQNYKISLSSNNSVMSIDSAVAIAGFGELEMMPADASSASLQTNDGKNAVIISDNQVKLSVDGATATLTNNLFETNVTIKAPDFMSNSGISLIGHVHGGVQTGSSNTGIAE